MSADETSDAKRARLLLEEQGVEEEAKAAAAAAELEFLELKSKFRKELGKNGVDFAVADGSKYGDGFIVVKLGSDLSFRKYVDAVHAAGEKGPQHDDVFAFVSPAVVHPSPERFAEIVRKRGRLLGRAADALASLHGVLSKTTEGKF